MEVKKSSEKAQLTINYFGKLYEKCLLNNVLDREELETSCNTFKKHNI